ncbi:MAG: hypothetical protein LC775_00470, partial [Acidobacteria bacterium]|nr:hypothetical protein [Acidobacteriota bacterium]
MTQPDPFRADDLGLTVAIVLITPLVIHALAVWLAKRRQRVSRGDTADRAGIRQQRAHHRARRVGRPGERSALSSHRRDIPGRTHTTGRTAERTVALHHGRHVCAGRYQRWSPRAAQRSPRPDGRGISEPGIRTKDLGALTPPAAQLVLQRTLRAGSRRT